MFKELFINVSELEAPEPFSEILYLTKELKQNSYIRVVHRKEPFPLYDILHENGFDFYTVKMSNSKFNIFIWQSSDIATANYCQKLQSKLSQT